MDLNDFITKATKIHGDKYCYSNVTQFTSLQENIDILCKTHNKIFSQRAGSHLYQESGCPKCGNNISKSENYITDFLENNGDSNIKQRYITNGIEIDIYSFKYNLGIEYHGMIYHSEGSTYPNNKGKFNRNLLLQKYNESKNKFKLFQIFENEWNFKQDIWKSMLLNHIKKSKKIYARQCVIKEIDSKMVKEFLELNHLQGYVSSKVRIGLFYNNELVSVMTFGTPRMNKKYEYELLRFCNKLNLSVIGGASKLLTYFKRNYTPKSIISYANKRWSTGNLYELLGFEYSHDTNPNYYYIHKNDNYMVLHSRYKFQKHKLNKLQFFDNNLTEFENMCNNGYRRIYDCGNLVYVWKTKVESPL
jgi:hypothetical protein